MNIQMTRLYEAAKELKGITGQSDLARALNTSPQTVNNWEARGMSSQGMVDAQTVLGCSATWLKTGTGPMVFAGAAQSVSAPNAHVTYLERVDLDEIELLSEYRGMSAGDRMMVRKVTGAAAKVELFSNIRNEK